MQAVEEARKDRTQHRPNPRCPVRCAGEAPTLVVSNESDGHRPGRVGSNNVLRSQVRRRHCHSNDVRAGSRRQLCHWINDSLFVRCARAHPGQGFYNRVVRIDNVCVIESDAGI